MNEAQLFFKRYKIDAHRKMARAKFFDSTFLRLEQQAPNNQFTLQKFR
jgi:hypothetical protein